MEQQYSPANALQSSAWTDPVRESNLNYLYLDEYFY